jgi:hypothetical protein
MGAPMTDPWPWPGDTTTERARRVANSLLALLPPDEAAIHIATAHRLGETWLGADLQRWMIDDVVPPSEAAGLVHATPAHLRSWVRMGVLTRTGRGYRVGDVLDASAKVHQLRRTRVRAVAKA